MKNTKNYSDIVIR